MTSIWAHTVGVALVLITTSACSQPLHNTQQQLTSLPVRIITSNKVVTIDVEIARTEAQRRTGLMGRRSLAANAGMLFVYQSERPANSGFWMFQTLIPLDIAYLGADGRIRAIKSMAPCPPEERCPAYPAGQPYTLALEVNQGFFDRHGITVGDQIDWNF